MNIVHFESTAAAKQSYIKAVRTILGITQNQLADALGVDHNLVHKIEWWSEHGNPKYDNTIRFYKGEYLKRIRHEINKSKQPEHVKDILRALAREWEWVTSNEETREPR